MPELALDFYRSVVQSGGEPVKRLLTPRLNRYIPHHPLCPEPNFPQALFLLSDALDAFYGGQAGGGKSDGLLIAALQYLDIPDYAALILRRTYKDLSLPGALMDRGREWLSPTPCHWSDAEKTWTSPEGGSLTFGYCEHETDVEQYRSAEFHFIGIDEATQFSEYQIRYLHSRLRRKKGHPVPPRFRMASNPGGVGHAYIKANYVDPATRGDREFFPARLEDNPYLDHEEYDTALKELGPVEYARLRKGDWEVSEVGKLFKKQWFPIAKAAPSEFAALCRYWDMASSKPTSEYPDPDFSAGVLLGKTRDGQTWVLDVQHFRETPLETRKRVQQTALLDKERFGYKVKVRMEQEPGSSGKDTVDRYAREELSFVEFKGVKSSGPKEERAGPISSQAEAGNVVLLEGPWNWNFLEELSYFVTKGVHDDQVDALSGAYNQIAPPKLKKVGWAA